MFKFQILASTNDKPRASVVALTHFSDLAEFIAANAAEALIVQRKGALKAMPSKAEILQLLQRYV